MKKAWIVIALALSACAGKGGPGAGGAGEEDEWAADEPTIERHAGAIDALGITPPETPWAEMDEFEREMYMAGKVMPVMQELFAREDAERYAKLTCEHCHGSDMREVAFAMPTKQLFAVPAPGTAAWEGMERLFGDQVKFMAEVVTPAMGTLLGEEGYTCLHCHVAAP